MGHMANEVHRGKGVQGVWDTSAIGTQGQWGTGGMGHMGNEAHRGYGVQGYHVFNEYCQYLLDLDGGQG